MADLDQSGHSLSICPREVWALKVMGAHLGRPPVPVSLTSHI